MDGKKTNYVLENVDQKLEFPETPTLPSWDKMATFPEISVPLKDRKN